MSFDRRGIFRSRCSFCSCDGYTAVEGSLKCVKCGHAPGKHEAINPFLPMPRPSVDGEPGPIETDHSPPPPTPPITDTVSTVTSTLSQECESLTLSPKSQPCSIQSPPNANQPSTQMATAPSTTTMLPHTQPQHSLLPSGTPAIEPLQPASTAVLPSPSSQQTLRMPESTVVPQENIMKLPADLQFLEDPPESLMCNICADILREPQVLTCCGDRVCKNCITKACERKIHLKEKAVCPFCNAEDYKLVSNVDLMNEILGLKVQCTQTEDGCKWTGQIRDLVGHQTTCKFYPIDCPNGCETAKFQRQTLEQHLSVCSREKVHCPFSSICCSTIMERKELQPHMKNNIHQHLLKISRKTDQVMTKCTTLAQSLQASCEDMLQKKDAKLANLKKLITEAENTVSSLERKLYKTQQTIKTLKRDQEQTAAEHNHELQVKGEEVMLLRDQHRETQRQMQALQGPQQAITTYVHVPVTFKLDRFTERKMLNDKWLSPPFYTHPGGYKMCISVYPNGIDEGQRTHVSLYVHFMTGEYDEWHEWPFQGQIVIIFMNQRKFLSYFWGDRGHEHKVVYLDSPRNLNIRERVFDITYGPGWGYDTALPHSKLGNFLNNDSLLIRIHEVLFLPL